MSLPHWQVFDAKSFSLSVGMSEQTDVIFVGPTAVYFRTFPLEVFYCFQSDKTDSFVVLLKTFIKQIIVQINWWK